MKKFQIFNCLKIDIPTTFFRFIYILEIQINFLKIGELFDEGKNLIVGNFDMAEKFEFFDVKNCIFDILYYIFKFSLKKLTNMESKDDAN